MNFQLIEHLIRKGRKQLEVMGQSDVTGLHLSHAATAGKEGGHA